MTLLLLDGVKYTSWAPEEEGEFEEIVKEHSKEIFGNDSLYVARAKAVIYAIFIIVLVILVIPLL